MVNQQSRSEESRLFSVSSGSTEISVCSPGARSVLTINTHCQQQLMLLFWLKFSSNQKLKICLIRGSSDMSALMNYFHHSSHCEITQSGHLVTKGLPTFPHSVCELINQGFLQQKPITFSNQKPQHAFRGRLCSFVGE